MKIIKSLVALILFMLLLHLCSIISCRSKKSDFKNDPDYKIDSTFKLSDSLNEKILIKFNKYDSVKNYSINFKYYFKENEEWKLKTEFDSLQYWREDFDLVADTIDFNDDKIPDFSFKAKQGFKGRNFWNHILLYFPKEKKFTYLIGSSKICAPYINKNTHQIVGIEAVGAYQYLSGYHLKADSLIEVRTEVWENDSVLVKKIK